MEFKVKVVSARGRPEIADNNGLCLPDKREILLHADMVREGEISLVLNTIVHELTHAVNCLFGISDASTEEAFTEFNTNGVIAMYLDNPRYVEWLVRTLAKIRAAPALEKSPELK